MATLFTVSELSAGPLQLVDLQVREVKPKDGISFKLEELYELLDCETIEIVYPLGSTYKGKILVIDEEGKLLDKPLNYLASLIYGADDDVIVGSALLCDSSEVK